ncbi:hypothetical protein K431DRAFT_307599 [Polychaeton citri CBS 116435]|uniref:NB-ARC domain-containing protein n=1 Tax=Polychaeton citri CBS 116435 TaxID=1314669 RepID=A0A9P4PZ26_9PEZI|nr:hypothetical protein K431DRAFT_307599 [Polychaeton citri CBS 116435]
MAESSTRISFGSIIGGIGVGVNHAPINTTVYPPPDRPETPSEPSSIIPFHHDPDHVERSALLDEVSGKLSVSGARVALFGLGGAGKTRLAVEYARQVRKRSPQTWALWLHAGTAARFEQSVRDVAEHMRIHGRHDPKANIFQLFRVWLCNRKKGEWLVILDSVDDAGFLFAKPATAAERRLIDYLPVCEHGSILFTTRSQHVASLLTHTSQIIHVPPMVPSDAQELLQKKLGGEERDRYCQLAVALDCLPLALAQAAAYIHQRRPKCSIKDYLAKLQNSRSRTTLLRSDPQFPDRDEEASSSILKTWQISFDYISRMRPSAADLLSTMSFCDPQAIPEILMHDNRSSDDSHDLDQVCDDSFGEDVTTLRSFSFISATTDRESWEMHRLVQDATRMWLEDRRRLEVFQARFIHRLNEVFPSGHYENWQACQLLFPHAQFVAGQPPSDENTRSRWASVMYHAAWYAWQKGQLAAAQMMAESSMQVEASLERQNEEQMLYSTAMLALILRARGLWGEAEKLQVQHG